MAAVVSLHGDNGGIWTHALLDWCLLKGGLAFTTIIKVINYR